MEGGGGGVGGRRRVLGEGVDRWGGGGGQSVAHRSSNALGCKPTDPVAVDSNVNGLSSTTIYSFTQSIQVLDNLLIGLVPPLYIHLLKVYRLWTVC